MVTLGRSALISGVSLLVSQGSDNFYRFRWSQKDASDVVTPVDLTGYTAEAQMRATVGSAIWVTLTSPDAIQLGADGSITILLGDEVTSAVEWNDYKTGVWDIELTSPLGVVTRFAEGTVSVAPDVTRDTVTATVAAVTRRGR